ncbi:MAG TPA: DNA mismatch repair protein MutS [Candidatus Angelobacter sp.]|nr:DNA mismatch repair protein MutS [Candidatus Angelobacter sp.]
MTEPSTPLMRQYAAIKKQHPNALLFFRLGDFYELFFEDAVVAARELQITLTSRNKEKDHAIPMCGVPYHAAENYLSKLLRKGFKVAICEQMEAPNAATKLVRREVTRVLTPGTAIDSSVGSEENNFLAALARASGSVGLAALDLSTGEFRATEFRGPDAERRIVEELQQLRPREVLYPSGLPLFDQPPMNAAEIKAQRENPSGVPAPQNPGNTSASLRQSGSAMRFTETPLEDWVFSPDYAVPLLENKLGVLSLEGFGLQGRPAAATAAGAILHYVRSTQRGTLEHVDRIGFYDRQEYLVLDAVTVRNLELVEPLFANTGSEVTLFRALDATLTPMGKRLLRSWMLRPSIKLVEISLRLDAVEAGVKEFVAREELRRALEGVLDIERLLSRVTLETANPRDVLALCASLNRIPRIKAALAHIGAQPPTPAEEAATVPTKRPRLYTLNGLLDEMTDLRERIEKTVVAEPPPTLADGGVIQPDVDKELDELRNLSRNSKQYIAQIEERERKRTGINSLKVKFNSVFGYYLEISKANLHHTPQDYERKQTLVNAERFTTPELKEYEAKVLDAQEKIVEIERRLFTKLRTAIAAEAKRIRQTSLALAEVDVLGSMAFIAQNRGYCRPQFTETHTETPTEKATEKLAVESDELEIIEGRHPVLEQLELTGSNDRFVPNDLYLNSGSHSILLITGPNMGGKSTYLRQTALMVLMAQMGGFVPARSARLPAVDRIFTRIGASDNLARGRSTFMVEMTETAAILNTATARSLILLDEIGRGTATYDGLAIAWAVIEYIHSTSRAKTLFATHYHELTELERLPGVKNFHVSVKENAGGIVFLRKVEPGAADRSYGIEVGKLAGLPPEVVVRAREVLHEHESAEQQTTAHLSPGASEPAPQMQLTMFTPLSQKIVDRLKEADLNNLTPMEAMNLLWELKKQL